MSKRVIVIHEGPNKQGAYRFTLFRKNPYPNDPSLGLPLRGPVLGQCYLSNPDEYTQEGDVQLDHRIDFSTNTALECATSLLL